jgi:ribosome-binding factor A
MNVPGRRHDRLADQIRGEVAGMLAAGEIKDPRLGFLTVTRVELTADLRHARILVSILGDEDAQRQTLAGLVSAGGYIRHELYHRLRLRHVPDLVFELDHGPEEATKIEALLQQLKREP